MLAAELPVVWKGHLAVATKTTVGDNGTRDSYRFPERPPGMLRTLAIAYRLIELGARTSLVCQLTSLPRATTKAWYQQIHGRSSPPGLSPFSDNWYVRSERHMLHTNIVWKLEQDMKHLADDRAAQLIGVYEAYLCIMAKPLLNITRAHFVSRLLAIKAWRATDCGVCSTHYIGPVTGPRHLCPGCILERIRRCGGCGAPLGQKGIGRRIRTCSRCGNSAIGETPEAYR